MGTFVKKIDFSFIANFCLDENRFSLDIFLK